MPPCRAALRLPPVARTCHPNLDWRNITRTPAAAIVNTQKLIGIVRNRSDPIQSQTTSVLALVEIATSWPCDASVKIPRTVINVPSVVSNAPQPASPASEPLTTPTATPVARLEISTTMIGRCKMWNEYRAANADIAKLEPTERSMPPAATTTNNARATSPPSDA